MTNKVQEPLILKDVNSNDKPEKQEIHDGESEIELPLELRAGSSQIQSLKSEERLSILLTMAEYLDHRLDDIYRANAVDESGTKSV